jgi:uncharacterized protein (DUF111 family)
VRTHQAQRKILDREFARVSTEWGDVRVKVSRLAGAIVNAAPEFEDCKKIAETNGVPLKTVIATATFEFQKRFEVVKTS